MPASRVTIKSIAADLGISHMTVSRALSGNPSVTAETTERVIRRASELGYVRSHAANVLRGRASRTVGLVLPNIENEFYAGLANAIAELAGRADLQVMIGLTHDDAEREHSVIGQLSAQQVGVIALVPAPGGSAQRPLNAPVILQVVRRREGLGAHQILIDDGPALAAAVAALANRGHTSIGYIGADGALSTGRHRLEAFVSAVSARGLRNGLTRTVSPSREAGAAALQSLLAQPGPPTAVVLGGVEISHGAISFALASGIVVPGALEIVGYGYPAWYRWVFGGLPAIQLPVAELAQVLVDWCIRYIEKGEPPESPPPLPARLMIR